jgi:hypothetical protein
MSSNKYIYRIVFEPKMDVGGGKLVGLVDLHLGEDSPHKTMEVRPVGPRWGPHVINGAYILICATKR